MLQSFVIFIVVLSAFVLPFVIYGQNKKKKVVDKHLYFWYTVQATFGEVSEWFKEPVLKTGDSERGRGFESHLLR